MTKPLFCCSEYLVDDAGFVISKRGKPLKPSTNHSGYQIIQVMIDGKRKGLSVHTAVARAFCEGYAPGLQVNHKDGNKKNNAASNLEWVTPAENMRHSAEVLGNDNRGGRHCNAKEVVGKSKVTGETLFVFPSVMSAARYFSPEDKKRARHIADIIYGIAGGYGTKRSYRSCLWNYT